MAGKNTKFWFCVGNVALRVLLIWIADLWDSTSLSVKFTDTDYDVFSDAAAHVAGGGSPYARKTYRYTPIAAYICLVNPWIHRLACKFIFVAVDILLALILWDLVELQLKKSSWKFTDTHVALFVSGLILNPLFFLMSTRGSNDQIIQALIFAAIWLLLQRRYILAGFVYGFSIHFKIYPIIFSFVFYFFIDCDRDLIAKGGNPYQAIISKKGFFTRDRIIFTAMTVGTLVILTGVFYPMYGYEYLYEAYLYHFVRKDHRHNNSVYWYLIYQLFDEPKSVLVGVLTFVPQWALVFVSGIALYYDLFTACFLQTWFFVMFNKVMTAQYYMWYAAFWPIILVNNRLATKPYHIIAWCTVWGLGQGVWGHYANAFENWGEPTLLGIQCANFLWLAINACGAMLFLQAQDLHLQAEFDEDQLK